MDGDNKILSTNIGFNEIEENGNWGDWLGGSWTNYDSQNTSDTSDDELRDSGSNSRVTKEISAVTLPAGITVADTVSEIVVETGTNRWVDPQGKESTSDFVRDTLLKATRMVRRSWVEQKRRMILRGSMTVIGSNSAKRQTRVSSRI